MTLTVTGVFTATGTVEELAMYSGLMISIMRTLNKQDEQREIDDVIAELKHRMDLSDTKREDDNM